MGVVPCCQNEMLKAKLPEMYGELEKCSKALEGYLEQKRSKFPRFYFCSNSKLLQILSQGSDPTTMNAHYETVFDALEKVDHDKKDKAIIRTIHGSGGAGLGEHRGLAHDLITLHAVNSKKFVRDGRRVLRGHGRRHPRFKKICRRQQGPNSTTRNPVHVD